MGFETLLSFNKYDFMHWYQVDSHKVHMNEAFSQQLHNE